MRFVILTLSLCWLGVFVPAFAQLSLELPSDAFVSAELEKHLSNRHPEEIVRFAERKRNNVLSIKAMFSLYGGASDARRVLEDFPRYSDWVMHRINERLDGSEFLLLVKTLSITPPTLGRVRADFSFNIPFFHKERTQWIDLKALAVDSGFAIRADSFDTEAEPFTEIRAYLRGVPYANTTRVYVDSAIRLRSRILYEAFPERVVLRETSDRIQRVIDAYHREMSRLRNIASANSTSTVR